MKDHDYTLMSKELQEILNSDASKDDEVDDVFKNALLIVGRKEYRCSILNVSMGDYSMTLRAKANKEVCLSLLRTNIETKVKLPEIFIERNNFILTTIEVEEGWIFKLTAAITNI